MVGLVDHQVKKAGLVGGAGVALVLPASGPMGQGLLHKLPHAAIGLQLGAEVESGSDAVLKLDLLVFISAVPSKVDWMEADFGSPSHSLGS